MKYNLADLDRTLIIAERNERIFEEFLTKGEGNKAIGFCCSINHANAMASFFNSKGIASIAITSETPNRDAEVESFRNNKYSVAFTVDVFNEGVDFPDIRVLLFLRPTESKTVFTQQLGRGLRLCGNKKGVVIIDFIGNYKKANNIRKFLSKNSKSLTNKENGRIEKIQYEYSPQCGVYFEAEVEQILDRQDSDEREITKEDLMGAYYDLVESLNRKPSQVDINEEGEYKVAKYLNMFGSWANFLKEIGEFTEFSYHFPQGTHLGHLLYILYIIGSDQVAESNIDPKYVRFVGGYDSGNIGSFQRQTKYKLQAAMEIGLLNDFRDGALEKEFYLGLTGNGQTAFTLLEPLLKVIDFSFKNEGDSSPSWSMNTESTINNILSSFLDKSPNAKVLISDIFLSMDAVNLLLKYLYFAKRSKQLKKSDIYSDFFKAPFVKMYLDRNGLEAPTEEVEKRRIPFLLNILEALGIISQTVSYVEVNYVVPSKHILQFHSTDTENLTELRSQKLKHYSISKEILFDTEEVSNFKELFGTEFLTEKYYLPIAKN